MSYLAQYKLLPWELMTVLGVIAKVILLPSGLLVLRIISSQCQLARGERLCRSGTLHFWSFEPDPYSEEEGTRLTYQTSRMKPVKASI